MPEEIYPMPSFVTLVVSDLEASARFYQDVLSFKHIFTMPGPGGQPALVHLRWTKYADLLIARPRAEQELSGPRGLGVGINFSLFERPELNIDSFAETARTHGAQVIGPVAQPWNVRELTVLDPDGYRLVFSVPVNIGLGFDKLLRQVTEP